MSEEPTGEEDEVHDTNKEVEEAFGAQVEWKVQDEDPPAKTLDDWVAVLCEGEPEPCAEAVEAIANMGEAVLPALRALQSDVNPDLVVDVNKAIRLIEDTLS